MPSRKVLLLLVLVIVAGCDRSAKTAAPAAARSPAAEPPSLDSETEQNAALRCAEDWQNEAYYRDTSRRHTAQERARGHSGVPDSVRKERDQNVMVRFMAQCEHFGFTWPGFVANDAAAEATNTALARLVESEVQKRRGAAELAQRQAQDREADESRARARQATCDSGLAQIARQREQAERLEPAARDVTLQSLDEAAANIRKEYCY